MKVRAWSFRLAALCLFIAAANLHAADLYAPLPYSITALVGGGDCNDVNANVSPAQAEQMGNRMDDDCDGLADEDANNMPSMDTNDLDSDQFSLAQFDCDDTNAAVHPGAAEIVGNYYDDDCDGMADENASDQPSIDMVDRDADHFSIAPDRIFASGFELP